MSISNLYWYLSRLSDEGDAVEKFMGVPFCDHPSSLHSYHGACPSKLLPLEVPTVLVAGTCDADIPVDMVENFYRLVTTHGNAISVPIELVKLDGANHYDAVNASTPAWERILDEMNAMLAYAAADRSISLSAVGEGVTPSVLEEGAENTVDLTVHLNGNSAEASNEPGQDQVPSPSSCDASINPLTGKGNEDPVSSADSIEVFIREPCGDANELFKAHYTTSASISRQHATPACLLPLGSSHDNSIEAHCSVAAEIETQCTYPEGKSTCPVDADNLSSCNGDSTNKKEEIIGNPAEVSGVDIDVKSASAGGVRAASGQASGHAAPLKQWGKCTLSMDSSSDDEGDGHVGRSNILKNESPELLSSGRTKEWGYALDESDDSSDDSAVEKANITTQSTEEKSCASYWKAVHVGMSSSDSEVD